jgi:hypothetical protein
VAKGGAIHRERPQPAPSSPKTQRRCVLDGRRGDACCVHLKKILTESILIDKNSYLFIIVIDGVLVK